MDKVVQAEGTDNLRNKVKGQHFVKIMGVPYKQWPRSKCASRERWWGTRLPIWRNTDGFKRDLSEDDFFSRQPRQ